MPFSSIVNKTQPAHASLRRTQQAMAERRRMETVINVQPGAASFEFAGSDRLDRHEQIVQPARTGQARVQRRREHRARFGELLFRVFDGQKLEEAFRTDAGPAGEEALK